MIAINIHSFLFEGVHIANNVDFIVIDLKKFVIFYLSKLGQGKNTWVSAEILEQNSIGR